MDFEIVNGIIGNVFSFIGLIVSIVACWYTVTTYRKSTDIAQLVKSMRDYKWNKECLSYLFETFPVSEVNSFFGTPQILRKKLWVCIDNCYYKQKNVELLIENEGKIAIKKFFEDFENIMLSHDYVELSNKREDIRKFEPLKEDEPYNSDLENQRTKAFESKIRGLRQEYETVKRILSEYSVPLQDFDKSASIYYENYLKNMNCDE